MFRSIQSKLVVVYLLLILVAMELTGLYLLNSLENYYLNTFRLTLSAQAQVLGGMAASYLDRPNSPGPDRAGIAKLAADWPAETGAVAILDSTGLVLGASRSQASLVGQRLVTDEITQALFGSPGQSVPRVDRETGNRTLSLAAPVYSGGRVVGVIYMKGSLEPSYEILANIRRIVLTSTVIALAVTGVLGILLARTITGPIREVTRKAALMAAGDFEQAISSRSNDEVGRLAEMFNHLARRLKETLDEISGERNKLEAIVAHMADGLVALDREGRIIKVNRAAARMLGMDPEAALGQHLHHLCPDLTAGAPLTEATAGGQATVREIRLTVGEEERVLLASGTPLKGVGTVLVLNDITAMQKLEQMRREFVANVSHELKTPLTTVKSYVETLLDGADEDPQLRTRFLRVVESETDRMVRLVRDLLHLSQLDQGTLQWDIQPYDLSLLAEEALAKLAVPAERKGLVIEREWAPGLPPARVDRDKMLQVLLNILANAIEFTPAGGTIRLAIDQPGEMLRVRIRDTGIGIPKQDQQRIFERFYRVDKARSRMLGGTGLGLAIARQIVEALGGTIALESEPGRGTEVAFTVPVETAAAAADPESHGGEP